MVVILTDELKRKSEVMRKYMLPNGTWKPDTPDYIKQYKDEISKYIANETANEM